MVNQLIRVVAFFAPAFIWICPKAAEVEAIAWNTRHAAPAATLEGKQKGLLPLIRLGVSALDESQVMQLTFLGGAALGLPPEKARSLHTLLAKRYRDIANDITFSSAPSALAYCYSAAKPDKGFASVYIPDSPAAKSNVILFLHGYGGSFTFYQHYLASAFPDHVIICPAYGISCANVPSAYLQECMDAVSKKLGFQVKRPVLMGLSAGGFGGFREYVRRSRSYAGFVCLAAYPPQGIVSRSPRDGRIRLVAGGDEHFVKNNLLRRLELSLKRRTMDYSSRLVPGQDHFFMLGAEKATKKILQDWNTELQTGK